MKRLKKMRIAKKKSFLAAAIGVSAILLVIAGVLVFDKSEPMALSSVENGYAAYSPSGFAGGAIVPASCESNYEHEPGECTSDVTISGTISANPTSCVANPTCSSQITWSSTNASNAQVWVRNPSGGISAFTGANAPNGSESASWIGVGTYTFYLYSQSGSSPAGNVLSQVNVTGNSSPTLNVTCSPQSQAATINQSVSMTASNGSGAYSWSADSSATLTSSNNAATVSYNSAGAKTVTVTSGGGTAQCTVNVSGGQSAPTFSVSLSANPSSGAAPLNDVDLSAAVSGTQTGTINYTFYCNRSDAGTNIAIGYAAKFDGQTAVNKTAADVCDYASAGGYTAKVIVERGSLIAEARQAVTVQSGGGACTPQTGNFSVCNGGLKSRTVQRADCTIVTETVGCNDGVHGQTPYCTLAYSPSSISAGATTTATLCMGGYMTAAFYSSTCRADLKPFSVNQATPSGSDFQFYSGCGAADVSPLSSGSCEINLANPQSTDNYGKCVGSVTVQGQSDPGPGPEPVPGSGFFNFLGRLREILPRF